MSEPNKYVVVVFKKENNVDVVPSTWTFVKDGGMFSYWPRLKKLEEVHLAARHEDPPNKKTWAKYQIRVLKGFGDYQMAVDSIEHYLAHSDYQESESSQHTSLVATPVSRIEKSSRAEIQGRHLNKEPDFAPPKAPPALLSSVLTATPTSSLSRRLSKSYGQSPLSRSSELALSCPPQENLDSTVKGPSFTRAEYSGIGIELDVTSPEAGELLDISSSYVTLDTNPPIPILEHSNVLHCEAVCEEFWNHHKRFHSDILSMLEKVSSSQAALNRKLDEVLEKIDNLKVNQRPDRDQPTYAFGSILPFKTPEDLITFSDSLKADGAKRKACVKFLNAIGGKDVSDLCYAMLKRLMTDDVALNFSFLGTATKRSFQALEINSVIFDALQGNKQLDASEKDIRERVMQFLHHAKDRLKSRGKAVNKKSQDNREGQSDGSCSS